MNTEISHVVVPGTFDPITLGHLDVIRRARKMFPQVSVAVALSARKNETGATFSLEHRVELVRASLDEAHLNDVNVYPFEGLLVQFVKSIGAQAVVKGLRAMTDFEYELQQSDLNTRMNPDIESIYVMSNPKYGFISSSVVREIASMGADVSMMVPACVLQHLYHK
ncbi:pantetheine-phosphate adenylyltransferase [Fannyhessea vaginae]|jgi:hypothetical protein|uniref:pantetheine-phosphate adenylyltransferase n=1 Tax=Fannyhessea vaginae TaxID=82135 RepID=UPI003369F8A6